MNLPSRAGAEPHSFPCTTVAAREQKPAWLSLNGSLIDVCGGPAYRMDNFSG